MPTYRNLLVTALLIHYQDQALPAWLSICLADHGIKDPENIDNIITALRERETTNG